MHKLYSNKWGQTIDIRICSFFDMSQVSIHLFISRINTLKYMVELTSTYWDYFAHMVSYFHEQIKCDMSKILFNELIWHEFPNFLFWKNCHCTAYTYRVFSFHEQMQCDMSYCVWKRSRHYKLNTDGVSFPHEPLQHVISFFVFVQS